MIDLLHGAADSVPDDCAAAKVKDDAKAGADFCAKDNVVLAGCVFFNGCRNFDGLAAAEVS